MVKTLDRTFDLSEDGLAARYRVRLYEPSPEESGAERVLLTSWELDQPGQPLDAWVERMADAAFDVLHRQGGPLLLVELHLDREYRLGGISDEITTARVLPMDDGTLALLDFGEMTRPDLESRIGESLTAREAATL